MCTRAFTSMLLVAAVVTAAGAGDVGHRPGAGSRQAELFLERVGDASITVLPTVVMDPRAVTHDHGSAGRIAAFLAESGLARSSRVAEDEVDLTATRAGTQWKVFKGGLKRVARHLKDHPVDSDYVLVAELLVTRTRSGGLAVGGIQCFVVDARGKDAHSFLLNSHHALFVAAGLSVDGDGPDHEAELREKSTDAIIDALRQQIAA